VNRDKAVGDPLPTPWRELNILTTLRTKELVVIGGGAGGGKSTFAVNLAHAVDYPVLYFAQDSPSSVLARFAALEVGHKTNSVYDKLIDPEQRERLAGRLLSIRPTLLVHEGAVSYEDVEARVIALEEYLGAPPPLVIIDNLIDMRVEGHTHNDAGFYSTVLPLFKQMAIKHNVCVMALHHVKRGADKQSRGNMPMNMDDLLFAGDREARHVLGVYTFDNSEVRVQILKQQDGPADADGKLYVKLRWIPSHTKLVGVT